MIEINSMTMAHLENELRKSGDPSKQAYAKVIARMHRDLGEDIPLPPTATVSVERQVIKTPEIHPEYRPFTEKEKRILREDGAETYTLTRETIEGQIKAGRVFDLMASKDDILLRLPSMGTDVAFYPDPKRFFIPGSGDKTVQEQEQLAREDAKKLRKRTGLGDDIVQIIPKEAATLTELAFKHLDKTTREGRPVWLFNLAEYAATQGLRWVYGVTWNKVSESSFLVAHIGVTCYKNNLSVVYGNLNGRYNDVLAARLIVAKRR